MGFGDPRFGLKLKFSHILDVQSCASYENFLSFSCMGKVIPYLWIRHSLTLRIMVLAEATQARKANSYSE